MLKLIIFFLWLCCITEVGAQQLYYEDFFKGGVSGAAVYNFLNSDPPEDTIEVYIEPGSTIRKAFLVVSHRNFAHTGSPNFIVQDRFDMTFNGTTIPLSQSMAQTVFSRPYVVSDFDIVHRNFVFDVTDLVDASTTSYPLQPTNNIIWIDGSSEELDCYMHYYLLVMFEHPDMETVNICVHLNDQDMFLFNDYALSGLNPMDLTTDVGLSIVQNSGGAGGPSDYGVISINGALLSDSIGAGEQGSWGDFYYQSGTLHGLGDDIANNTMFEEDALSVINTYLDDNTGYVLSWSCVFPPNYRSNQFHQFYTVYQTSCAPFEHSLTPDTSACIGDTVTLHATGGISYAWTPAAGLSCTDCPSPSFVMDSTHNYSVRISNNDSCGVTRSVRIDSLPNPTIAALDFQAITCGLSDGAVEFIPGDWGNIAPMSYAINNEGFVNTPTFSGGAITDTLFSIQNGLGCRYDTLVYFPVVNSAAAIFEVTPLTGVVPFTALLSDYSTNTEGTDWYVNGIYQGSSLNSYAVDTSGVYTFTLHAWEYDSSCVDTATLSILAIKELIIPTAFTPNGDAANDVWELGNLDASYPGHTVRVFNRLGNVLYESAVGAYDSNPWDGTEKGSPLPVGSYYYIIDLGNGDKPLTGTVSIILD